MKLWIIAVLALIAFGCDKTIHEARLDSPNAPLAQADRPAAEAPASH